MLGSASNSLAASFDSLNIKDNADFGLKTPSKDVLEENKTPASYNSSESPEFVSPTRNVRQNAKRVSMTKINSIPGLPSIRKSDYNHNAQEQLDLSGQMEHDNDETALTIQHPQEWNASVSKKAETSFAHRCPWTPDLRMRKSPANGIGNNDARFQSTASPRTPFVSQANVKRMKQVSQLSRAHIITPAAPVFNPADDNENPSFAKPKDKPKACTIDGLKAEVAALTKKLSEETKAKNALEEKYQNEVKKRLKLEMELKLLKKEQKLMH